MPRKVTKGTGMMKREVASYDISADASAEETRVLGNHMREWASSLKGPDATREVNAETCREILRRAGAAPEDMDVQMRFGDDSAQYLAYLWLTEFRRVSSIRSRIESGGAKRSDMETMLYCAEEMGKLQERMWWRRGVDPESRARREELAIERRRQRTAFRGQEAQDQWREAMRPKMEAAIQWRQRAQEMAKAHFQRHPGCSKTAAAKHILKNWPAELPMQSESTVRQAIRKS